MKTFETLTRTLSAANLLQRFRDLEHSRRSFSCAIPIKRVFVRPEIVGDDAKR